MFISKTLRFAAAHAVTLVAFAAAAVTCFFVPPDGEYIGYFDFRTLSCLFCTIAVVTALKRIGFFRYLARRVVGMFGTERACLLALTAITFFGSMFMANDMALITFLPLGCLVMAETKSVRLTAFTLILQNTAANLGGMLTPFGNPQNLYLFSYFSIPAGEFMLIMLPPFLMAAAMIGICCVFARKKKIELPAEEEKPLPAARTIIYGVLFLISILMVFRAVPYQAGIAVVFVSLMIADRRAVYGADWGLLLTFAFFFVFSGNMARIPEVSAFFGMLLSKSVLLSSTASCQLISNVPTAVLLSRFTENYTPLLLGVNIGGVGTLVSSLASLITFGEFRKRFPGKTRTYLALFTALSFTFLAVLTVFCGLVYGF